MDIKNTPYLYNLASRQDHLVKNWKEGYSTAWLLALYQVDYILT